MKWIFLAFILFVVWSYQQPNTQKFLSFILEKQKTVSYQLKKSPKIRALAQNTKNEIAFLIPKLEELRESGFKNKPILNLKEIELITNMQKAYLEKMNHLENQISDLNESKRNKVEAEISNLAISFNNELKNAVGNKKFLAIQEWRSSITRQLNNSKTLK